MDFLERVNDLIAPITRAWNSYDIITIQVKPSRFSNNDELEIEMKVLLKKR